MKVFGPVLFSVFLLLPSDFVSAGSATWRPHPSSGDWNTVANWTPATVPNGDSDTATFAISNQTIVSNSQTTTVDSIIFDTGASAFTVTANPLLPMTFGGAGIINNSGIIQNFASHPSTRSNMIGGFAFTNSASAGEATFFTIFGGEALTYDTPTYFLDSSSAGTARFLVKAATVSGGVGTGDVRFSDDSSAANASFTLEGASVSGGGPGVVFFDLNSTASNARFLLMPGAVTNAAGAAVDIFSSAGNATFRLASAVQGYGGTVNFSLTASAGTATFVIDGAGGGFPSTIYFSDDSTADNATLIANGGVEGGGIIKFFHHSDGGTARIELFDNGTLDLTYLQGLAGIGVGSIEGNGLIILGDQARTRPFLVGRNNRSTVFSGTITGARKASLVKVGTGSLTLSNANTYTGGTEIDDGQFLVSNITGSATGTGTVAVAKGTLGGSGIIVGKVTIGTGTATAFLVPAPGAMAPATLTIQDTLTFGPDGIYTWKIDSRHGQADQVAGSGITIAVGASFSVRQLGNVTLTAGTSFTVISNTAATPISGTFANLPNGGTITVGGNTFQANYEGGDGNDLTLTVVP